MKFRLWTFSAIGKHAKWETFDWQIHQLAKLKASPNFHRINKVNKQVPFQKVALLQYSPSTDAHCCQNPSLVCPEHLVYHDETNTLPCISFYCRAIMDKVPPMHDCISTCIVHYTIFEAWPWWNSMELTYWAAHIKLFLSRSRTAAANPIDGMIASLVCCFRYRFTDASNIALNAGARCDSSSTTLLNWKVFRSVADVWRKTDFFPGNVEHKAWHSCRTSEATALIISFFKRGIFIASIVNEW